MLRFILTLLFCLSLSGCGGTSGNTRVYFPTLAKPGEQRPTPMLEA